MKTQTRTYLFFQLILMVMFTALEMRLSAMQAETVDEERLAVVPGAHAENEFTPFITRRKLLLEAVKKAHPDKKGAILLLAGFEDDRFAFRQESSFYYFTGLEEPGVVLLIEPDGKTILFIPNYRSSRSKWFTTIVDASQATIARWGISELQSLGGICTGSTSYSISSAFVPSEYEKLLAILEQQGHQEQSIFAHYPADEALGRVVLDRLLQSKQSLKSKVVDISSAIAALRRIKSKLELALIAKAVDCTLQAHRAAAVSIKPDRYEHEIQAEIEYIFKKAGGSAAYPSIVGSGKNGTVLHYIRNDSRMRNGDLVVVDAGALLNGYCADITRTFPVSGTFTDRQRQIYNLVRETQAHVASMAKPGYWIADRNHKDKSLFTFAYDYLKARGYEQYFTHGIGHYIGLDVHDAGSYAEPLQEGDVITIEPGIYIPEENIGVRIEDMYLVTKDGLVCLSEKLPRDPNQIEQMMAGKLDEA